MPPSWDAAIEGVQMTKALVTTLEGQVDPRIFRGIVVSLMHQFLGPYASTIELPRANWTQLLGETHHRRLAV